MSKPRALVAFGGVLVVLLAACGWLAGSPSASAGMTVLEVFPETPTWACEQSTLALRARVRLGGAAWDGAQLLYRFAADEAWQTQAMYLAAQDADAVVLEAVLPRGWPSADPAPAEMQYAVVVHDAAGETVRWPAQEETYAAVRITACDEPAAAPTAPTVPPVAGPSTATPEPTATTAPVPPQPTATEGNGGMVVTVLPSPTPTPMEVANPPTATPTTVNFVVTPLTTPTVPVMVPPYSSGEENNLREWNFFDLDEGTRFTSFNLNADFQLYPGDDPYLDQIRPFNGATFAWFGANDPTATWPDGAPPSFSDCKALEHTGDPLTIQWPDMENTFFCYKTSAGRRGWLRVKVWVSLPINERRLLFQWVTWHTK